jgi:hypothetical protein
MAINDLLAGPYQHRQSVTLWVRLTGLGAFEGVRKIGVRQEFTGDSLGIDGVTLAASGPPTPALRSTGRADVSNIYAGLGESHREAPPPRVRALDRPYRIRRVLAGPGPKLTYGLKRRTTGPVSEPATPCINGDRAEDTLVGIDANNCLHHFDAP